MALSSTAASAAGSVGETRRGRHRPIGVGRALLVADAIQRRQHLFGELAGGFQNSLGHLGVVVGEDAGRGEVGHAGHGFQGEGQVPNGRAIGHGLSSIVCAA